MSKTENALATYARTKRAIEEHIAANRPIFDAHQALVLANVDARAAVEDAAAEEKATVTGEGFRVTVVPQTRTFVDPDALKARQGQTLTPSVIAELVQTQERPPRISITELK